MTIYKNSSKIYRAERWSLTTENKILERKVFFRKQVMAYESNELKELYGQSGLIKMVKEMLVAKPYKANG